MSYLLGGGNLYIEGVDLGKDHSGTELMKKLGINFIDDGHDIGVENLTGSTDNFMGNIFFDYEGGADAHFKVDELSGDEAAPLLFSEDGLNRMFAFDAENYKAISSSIIFSALKDGDSLSMKPYLMSEIVSYFLDIDTVSSTQEIFSKDVEISIFPNPFKTNVNIALTLDYTQNIGLEIFSIDGKLIKSIGSEVLNSGKHKFEWDGKTNTGEVASNGIYFLKIYSNNKIINKKLIISR